jgi:hypothetical protein
MIFKQLEKGKYYLDINDVCAANYIVVGKLKKIEEIKEKKKAILDAEYVIFLNPGEEFKCAVKSVEDYPPEFYEKDIKKNHIVRSLKNVFRPDNIYFVNNFFNHYSHDKNFKRSFKYKDHEKAVRLVKVDKKPFNISDIKKVTKILFDVDFDNHKEIFINIFDVDFDSHNKVNRFFVFLKEINWQKE